MPPSVVLQLQHDMGGTAECTVTRSEEKGLVAECTSTFPNLRVICNIVFAGNIKRVEIRIDQQG